MSHCRNCGYEIQGETKVWVECGLVQAFVVPWVQGSPTGSVGRFKQALLLGLLLVVITLAMGGSGSGSGKTLDIADIGWTENTAIAGLTKVLLEEELGYEKVIIHTNDLNLVYDSVANGDLDAFQDVWLPNQRDLLSGVENDVELLDFWYQGQTKQGIGVPSYTTTKSLDQLNESDADLLLGIEPSSVIMERIFAEVVPPYDLHQKLVEASTEDMLAEVERRYQNQEEFAFVACWPHWMNQRYEFRYLEDPKDAFGNLDAGATVHMIVNENLRDYDPVTYAFMDALTLIEEQLNDLESTSNEEGDPLAGARVWAENNREVWQPRVEAVRGAQES